jgi:hypothetical protein
MTGTCNGSDGGGPGTRYTFAELEGLWVNAGGSQGLAATMAAIALAESGGCTSDLNTTDNSGTQTSWGLWQISNGTHSPPGANWSTGAGNAALAVAKLKSQGLTAWGTYNTGEYKRFLNGNPPAPDTSVSSGATAATLTAADSSPDCLISFPSGKVLFVGTVGGGCALSKPEARAVTGSLILFWGGVTLIIGAAILAAYGLKSAGASKVAGRALELGGAAAAVAGAPEVGVPLAAAGAVVRSQGASRAASSAAVSRGQRQVRSRQAAARSPRSQPGGRPARPPSP